MGYGPYCEIGGENRTAAAERGARAAAARRARPAQLAAWAGAALWVGVALLWGGGAAAAAGGAARGGVRARSVAVVASGGLRTFAHCNASVFDLLIKRNPRYTFDFYVYAVTAGPAPNRAGAAAHKAAIAGEEAALAALQAGAHPRLRRLAAISTSDARRTVLADVPGLADLPHGNGTARGKAVNVASMFRSMQVADALRTADEAARGFVHAVVVRIRPDLRLCAAVDLSAAERVIAQHADTVLVPFATERLVGDQFAIASAQAMVKYAKGFDALIRRGRLGERKALYPEHELWRHLAQQHLSSVALPAFRASLVRQDARHRPLLEDAYGKLRADFPALEGIGALPPATLCGAALL
ncbi:hypothetical protein M885DRAFT_627196 [Pelagophyceae sp. CCMP2097]|nr:hypothetical protein M885DRAFT_627196 [Pelagophyceae sp. CCMP2097]